VASRMLPVVRSVSRMCVGVALLVAAAHVAVLLCTTMRPPALAALPNARIETSGAVRRVGNSYVKRHGAILQVGLAGGAEEIGDAHAQLLYPQILAGETALWSVFEQLIGLGPARALLLDASRVRFRSLDSWVPEPRRRELAALARAFSPDPFNELMPTYQRFTYLNALYDISLSFEHSPLIGCSSLALTGFGALDGHTLVGRTFDFETHDFFDLGKAVLVIQEQDRIALASVAWPGLAGVVTGINAYGLAMIVHGARAGSPDPDGEPALLTIRGALSQCRSMQEAAAYVAARPPMISHLVFIVDPTGRTAVVERVPAHQAHVREQQAPVALTNHFEGPSSIDPANLRVRDTTSTLTRRARLQERIGELDHPAGPADVVDILRDRKSPGGKPLPAGDRRAIDAQIATHGVVMDLTARRIWVSQGPHLDGRFVRFDLNQLMDEAYCPELDDPLDPIP
jgi:isopenicillin-N N-acyltransferase like protein